MVTRSMGPDTAARGIWSPLWQLSRPRTCLVGILAYTFGMEIAGGDWAPATVVGAVSMLLMPAIANLHNSYTDLAEDAKNLPGRVALVAAVGVGRLRRIVFLGLIVVVVGCAALGSAGLFVGLAGAGFLLSYSTPPFRAKARPVLGLLVFSMVVSVPFVLGVLTRTGEGGSDPELLRAASIWGGFLTLLFLAKGLVKNVPDYEGDLAAGVRTSASVMPSIAAAAHTAVVVTWLVYVAYPAVVFLTGAKPTLYIAAIWIPIAAWHVHRLMTTTDPGRLNNVLKWDMCITVGFEATLAILPRASAGALTTVALCLLLLALADVVGADSRAAIHLPEQINEDGLAGGTQ